MYLNMQLQARSSQWGQVQCTWIVQVMNKIWCAKQSLAIPAAIGGYNGVHLDWDERRPGINELRLVLFSGDGFRSIMGIWLGDWTIEEAIQQVYDEALKNSGALGQQMASVPIEQVLPPAYFASLINLTLIIPR